MNFKSIYFLIQVQQDNKNIDLEDQLATKKIYIIHREK